MTVAEPIDPTRVKTALRPEDVAADSDAAPVATALGVFSVALGLAELLYRRTLDRGELAAALELPLVPSWRAVFARRLEQGGTESWDSRLGGPAR